MAKNQYRYFNIYYWIRKFTFSSFFQNIFVLPKSYKRKIVFKSIFKSFHWRDYNKPKPDESVSGLGSDLHICEDLINDLDFFINKHEIKSILDLACGDFNWMKKLIQLNKKITSYCGLEIVDEIVKKNIISYSNDKIKFIHSDIMQDTIPKNFDLVIIRDFFIHISNNDIKKVINKVKQSNVKYVAIGTLSNIEINRDLKAYGHHRSINIEKQPFNLKKPYLKLKDSVPRTHYRDLNIYDLKLINEKS